MQAEGSIVGLFADGGSQSLELTRGGTEAQVISGLSRLFMPKVAARSATGVMLTLAEARISGC